MHRGGEEEEGELSMLPALLAELDGPLDEEHPDVAVSDDETGWALSVFQSGKLVWENPDNDDEPRHVSDLGRDAILRAMTSVATGNLDDLEQFAWSPGY
jgi:hypothetical protein